jgi:murein endopeptidase
VRGAVLLLVAAAALVAGSGSAGAQVAPPGGGATPPGVVAPRSVAVGKPWHGRLRHGLQLPASGPGFDTWDFVRQRSPDRSDRRWGTDELVAMLESVALAYAIAHPTAPPLLIADLSRPHGGPFGKRFGGLGHASHQNGLDADVAYPRLDGLPIAPVRPSDVDRVLAQELVNRFVLAGAVKVFVGPHVGLTGPRRIVQKLVFHDDHLHVRIRNPGR